MSIQSPEIWRRTKKIKSNIGKIGIIESFTFVHVAPSGFDRYAPYPVAIAKFGNKKIIGQLTDYRGKSLEIGSKVKAVLRRSRREDDREIIEYVIKFQPMQRVTEKIRVSAPGKLHLLGEHSVVYNKPAIITAVDRRCIVEITPREDNKIKVFSKNFNKELMLSSAQIIKKFLKAQKDWDKFDRTNDISTLKSITQKPLDYPFIIIGQFINHYNLKNLFGFDLTIDSEIPVGVGMGSSGALAVAIAGALSLFAKKPFDKKVINEIAYQSELKRHGKPSGGDNSTSCYGGLVWFKKDEGITPMDVKLSDEITNNFYNINTGTPKESTGEMVGRVRKLHEEQENYVDEIFDDQEKLVKDLFETIEKKDAKRITGIIKKGEANLEKIGAASSYVKKIIRDIETSGGVGKICGGGGVTKSTGIILIYHEDLKKLEKVLKSHQLEPTQLKLGVEGLREEKI